MQSYLGREIATFFFAACLAQNGEEFETVCPGGLNSFEVGDDKHRDDMHLPVCTCRVLLVYL